MDSLPGDQTERILSGETALKVWREHLGISADEVGGRAGLTVQQLAELEQGTAPLDAPTLARLATALGVDPAWIEREVYED